MDTANVILLVYVLFTVDCRSWVRDTQGIGAVLLLEINKYVGWFKRPWIEWERDTGYVTISSHRLSLGKHVNPSSVEERSSSSEVGMRAGESCRVREIID